MFVHRPVRLRVRVPARAWIARLAVGALGLAGCAVPAAPPADDRAPPAAAAASADAPPDGAPPATLATDSRFAAALEDARRTSRALGLEAAALSPSRGHALAATGFADTERTKPLTPRDRFRVGSLTKTFTAALVLLHVEDGDLALESTIDRFFPDFPGADRITVAHLLSHTSGVAAVDNQARVIAGIGRAWTPEELIAVAADAGLLFEPGSGFQYSNLNFIMLGAIVEKVGKGSYESQLSARILRPLKMGSTGLDPGHGVDGMVEGREGAVGVGVDVTKLAHMSIAWSAGALVTTADDVLTWITSLFGGKVLRPETLERMKTPTRLTSGEFAHGEENGRTFRYGLGLMLVERGGRTLFGHSGATPGYRSYSFWDPDRGALTILSNDGGMSDVATIWDSVYPIALPR